MLWCLREAGYRACALGNPSANALLRFSPLVEKFFDIPPADGYALRSPEILALISSAVKQEKIDIIVPSGFESLKFISQYQDELRRVAPIMPVPTLESISLLGNKQSFALFCVKNDIPHPKTILLEDPAQILKDDFPVVFPVMTKPRELDSGKGIYRFDDKTSLFKYVTTPRADAVNALPLLLQEFLEGDDIDFNGFCRDGVVVAWTIQHITWFKAVRWLQFVRNDEVLRIGKRIAEVTRYSGPIHLDLRFDARDNSVKTIEVNPRFWASMVASTSDGVNFGDAAIRSAFDGAYSARPLYANRVWGAPARLPGMIFRTWRGAFFRGLALHTYFQFKYMLLDRWFDLVSRFRRAF
jgi:predicted ATP-grasp superfamily ATP-dependent carboligase